MDLFNTLKELKNSRKTGVPYDSENSAWKTSFKTLGKKWNQVPRGASASEKTTNLITLSAVGGETVAPGRIWWWAQNWAHFFSGGK